MTRPPNRAWAWLTNTSRRRRATFYAVVVGMLLIFLTPAMRFILTILQFNDTAVTRWSDALRGEALSLVALLVLAAYLDLVARRDQQDDTTKEREKLVALVRDEYHTAAASLRDELQSRIDQAIKEIPDDLIKVLPTSISDQLATELGPIIRDLDERQLNSYTPVESVSSGLQRVLGGDPHDVSALAESILGRGWDYVLSDATYSFAFESLNDSTIRVDARHTQMTRFTTYRVALVRDNFTSESRLLSSGTLSDAWIFTDDGCYQSSIGLASQACVIVRYRDQKNVLVRESRPFQIRPADEGGDHINEVVLEVDLSVPDGARATATCEVCVSVVLPANPSGFRWLFDTPTFMREMSFDIRNLYRGDSLDVTLYPFLMGTEDYTLRSVERQDIYRIGLNAWLLRGHGVFLNWEKGNGNKS